MSQVLVDPARLVAEGDVLWAIGHRVEASIRTCESALGRTGGWLATRMPRARSRSATAVTGTTGRRGWSCRVRWTP
ncbi:hypothetical protein ACDF64_07705 [Agromyces sp. MMS24-JH15]|uniref:hypothetical protein n=1 Tax=Agromyces sp. MMS24-JH15 TaxID=3243765 RepID=UPI0037480230